MEVYDYYITPQEYEIASKNNISRKRVNQRIRRFGWSKRRAITESPRVVKNDYSEWLPTIYKNGISRQTFYFRLKSGWNIDKAATMPVMTREEVLKMIQDRAKKKVRKYPKEILELAKSNGIGYSTFNSRVSQSKWDMMRAATTPVMTRRKCGLLAKKETGKYIAEYYKLKNAKAKNKANILKQ